MSQVLTDNQKATIKEMVRAGVEKGVKELVEERYARNNENQGTKYQVATEQKQHADEGKARAGLFLKNMAIHRDSAKATAECIKSEPALFKALSTGDFSAGGALVPEPLAPDLIEYLRGASIVRMAGPRVLEVVNSLSIPAYGGASSYWVAENVQATESNGSSRQVKVEPKKLVTLSRTSKELVTDAINGDQFIIDDMRGSHSQEEDATFIRSAGAGGEPKGLYYQAQSANRFAATIAGAAATTGEKIADLGKLLNTVETAQEGNLGKFVWLLSNRDKNSLMFSRDANSNMVLMAEMRGGTLFGFPFFASTNIPSNLGAGTNESEVYGVDMNNVVIGQNNRLELAVSEDDKFDLYQLTYRLVSRVDLAVRQEGKGVGVITGAKWTVA